MHQPPCNMDDSAANPGFLVRSVPSSGLPDQQWPHASPARSQCLSWIRIANVPCWVWWCSIPAITHGRAAMAGRATPRPRRRRAKTANRSCWRPTSRSATPITTASPPSRRHPTAGFSPHGICGRNRRRTRPTRTRSCSASPRTAASHGRRWHTWRRDAAPPTNTATPTRPMWSTRKPARSSCSA